MNSARGRRGSVSAWPRERSDVEKCGRERGKRQRELVEGGMEGTIMKKGR